MKMNRQTQWRVSWISAPPFIQRDAGCMYDNSVLFLDSFQLFLFLSNFFCVSHTHVKLKNTVALPVHVNGFFTLYTVFVPCGIIFDAIIPKCYNIVGKFCLWEIVAVGSRLLPNSQVKVSKYSRSCKGNSKVNHLENKYCIGTHHTTHHSPKALRKKFN